ncbi:MAG: VanZ family protein [Rhodobiaceae bacterium]|nr:VanZ family protein [Rhodobiaceae bacterium]
MTLEDDRDNTLPAGIAQAPSLAQPWLSPQRRIALIGWSVMMLVITALSLWPQGVVSDHYHLDKVGHFLAYTGLAFLPTLFAKTMRQAALIVAVICVIGLGLEGGQALLPGRVPSLLDAAANLSGALFGACAGLLARPILKQILREMSA